ncbi:RNA polymerase sigma factor [Aliidiomarina haloalkalitolerans]|uniref:RNA polymerase sigma factor n=1 Tax=Aliidiomarina haloalkalitolerans TaxID=859059 RepID=A0A432VUL8_9GAMM|nr:RNA polymerase sigma factor [Aliidiomarina haloalkalitolerans]RUO20220.1 RNA polymerase sigma factor [Aliidiomarina haloalkalitolerans]
MQTTGVKHVVHPYLQWYEGGLALARSMLRCNQAAQDVLQSAFDKALVAKRLPEDEPAQRVWFYKVIRNGCLDVLRYSQRFVADSEIELFSSSESFSDPVELSQQQVWVRQALMRLNSEQREIIVLRDVNELSYAEIAQVLQLNSGTVMSRLHRARLALREQLLALAADEVSS